MFDLFDVQDEINRLFEGMLPRKTETGKDVLETRWTPFIDLAEDKDAVYVKAEIPGMNQDQISVTIEDNVLSIKGERKTEKEEKEKQFYRRECLYGIFNRSVQLPSFVDETKIKATYKNGILEMTLPKKEEAKQKQIKVNIQ